MRKTSSDSGGPWCAPTREVASADMLALARKTRRTTDQHLLAQSSRYQLATLEDRELADGSTPDMIDPFRSGSIVTTVVVPTPIGAVRGKTWALVVAIVLMLATAAGVTAIVLFS